MKFGKIWIGGLLPTQNLPSRHFPNLAEHPACTHKIRLHSQCILIPHPNVKKSPFPYIAYSPAMATMTANSVPLGQLGLPVSALCDLASTLSSDIISVAFYVSQMHHGIVRGLLTYATTKTGELVDAGDDEDDDEEEFDDEEGFDEDEGDAGEGEGDEDEEEDGEDGQPPAKRRRKDDDEEDKKKKDEEGEGEDEDEEDDVHSILVYSSQTGGV
jgi:hypothetical protein